MQRITITLDDDLMTGLDQLIAARGYQSRSEAIRDLARAGIQQALLEQDAAPNCVAALVYVYQHEARELARRLTKLFHDHHDLSMSRLHVPLNHETALEVALLGGSTARVQALADTVLAERGVRHGKLVLVPAEWDDGAHSHEGPDGHTHHHVRTRL